MRATTRARSIDHLLAEAREEIIRLTPEEAYAATVEGAVLVDVRSEDERCRQGVVVPGAVHYPLSVVAWRLDPDCPTANPKLDPETHVILLCREGYSSSLAAWWLRQIGFDRASDVVDGVDGWRSAGLPLAPHPA
jgi:rhodanese-related sulfurtransferase